MTHKTTSIVVDKDFLVSRIMHVIVDIAHYDSKCIGNTSRWASTVFHNDGQIIFFLFLTIENCEWCHYTGTMLIITSTWWVKCKKSILIKSFKSIDRITRMHEGSLIPFFILIKSCKFIDRTTHMQEGSLCYFNCTITSKK